MNQIINQVENSPRHTNENNLTRTSNWNSTETVNVTRIGYEKEGEKMKRDGEIFSEDFFQRPGSQAQLPKDKILVL